MVVTNTLAASDLGVALLAVQVATDLLHDFPVELVLIHLFFLLNDNLSVLIAIFSSARDLLTNFTLADNRFFV